MSRFTGALSVCLFSCIYIAGCGGAGAPAPPPPPAQNPAPSVISVTPSSAVGGSTDTSVTITGGGYISTSTVQLNGVAVATTFNSATSLGATLPASSLTTPGTAKLTVTNPAPGGGTSAALDFSVNNPAPAIAKSTPSSVIAGSGATLLDITGTGFLSCTVIVFNTTPLTTVFVSATEVKAAVPAAALTSSSVSVITTQNPPPGGGASPAATFNVNSPAAAITSISPRTVPPGAPATIYDHRYRIRI